MPELEEGNLYIRGTFPDQRLAGRSRPTRPQRRGIMLRSIRRSVAVWRRSAGPTTAPTRPASTTSKSSCRSEAAGRVARSHPRAGDAIAAHQAGAGRRDMRRAGPREHSRRRLELLADHSRQRDGDRCPASKAKTRSRSSAPTSTSWNGLPAQVAGHAEPGPGHRERRRLPHQGADRTSNSPSIARSAPVERERGRRAGRSSRRPSAARPSPKWSKASRPSTSRSAGPSDCEMDENQILDIPVDVDQKPASSRRAANGPASLALDGEQPSLMPVSDRQHLSANLRSACPVGVSATW